MAGFILNGNVVGGSDVSYIANVYSTSSTYAVGNYCVVGDTLYRCTTAVTTAGNFDPSKWTSVILVDDLANIIDTVKEEFGATHTFALATTIWVANTDPNTSTDYPYVAVITSSYYTDDSAPIWDLLGAGNIPTSTERESMNMIMEAYFDHTGVILYATDQPTVALTLRVKGL